jgi:hypothetical protein
VGLYTGMPRRIVYSETQYPIVNSIFGICIGAPVSNLPLQVDVVSFENGCSALASSLLVLRVGIYSE